jgi:hypothetical protein
MAPRPSRAEPLPPELRATLGAGTAEAWEAFAPHLPPALYLAGGTGVAVHLHHRKSADLDFFYHHSSVDLDRLAEQLSRLGPFAITRRAPGTLRGLFAGTKVEFLHADEVRPQVLLREPIEVAGLRVASLEDLMAMKLKVIGDRGEARDYFDAMAIDDRGCVTLEDGIALFLERYELLPSSDVLSHLIAALGYLGDVEQDDALPIGLEHLTRWWQKRQARLVRGLGRRV